MSAHWPGGTRPKHVVERAGKAWRLSVAREQYRHHVEEARFVTGDERREHCRLAGKAWRRYLTII